MVVSIKENNIKDLEHFLEHSIYSINTCFRVSDSIVKTEYPAFLNHTLNIYWVPALCQALWKPLCWVRRRRRSTKHITSWTVYDPQQRISKLQLQGPIPPRPVFVREVPWAELSSPGRVGWLPKPEIITVLPFTGKVCQPSLLSVTTLCSPRPQRGTETEKQILSPNQSFWKRTRILIQSLSSVNAHWSWISTALEEVKAFRCHLETVKKC